MGSIPIVSTTVSATAVLLISCPDTSGIVADVASWVAHNGGNIVHAEQHTDTHDSVFFQRVEFTHSGEQTLEQLSTAFAPIATKFNMNFSLRALPWNPRTAILVSKTVHCLSDLLTRSRYGDLGLDVAAVVSNHNDSRELVEAFGYRYEHIPVEEGKRAEQEQTVNNLLTSLNVDLVVLARYMFCLLYTSPSPRD